MSAMISDEACRVKVSTEERKDESKNEGSKPVDTFAGATTEILLVVTTLDPSVKEADPPLTGINDSMGHITVADRGNVVALKSHDLT